MLTYILIPWNPSCGSKSEGVFREHTPISPIYPIHSPQRAPLPPPPLPPPPPPPPIPLPPLPLHRPPPSPSTPSTLSIPQRSPTLLFSSLLFSSLLFSPLLSSPLPLSPPPSSSSSSSVRNDVVERRKDCSLARRWCGRSGGEVGGGGKRCGQRTWRWVSLLSFSPRDAGARGRRAWIGIGRW